MTLRPRPRNRLAALPIHVSHRQCRLQLVCVCPSLPVFQCSFSPSLYLSYRNAICKNTAASRECGDMPPDSSGLRGGSAGDNDDADEFFGAIDGAKFDMAAYLEGIVRWNVGSRDTSVSRSVRAFVRASVSNIVVLWSGWWIRQCLFGSELLFDTQPSYIILVFSGLMMNIGSSTHQTRFGT